MSFRGSRPIPTCECSPPHNTKAILPGGVREINSIRALSTRRQHQIQQPKVQSDKSTLTADARYQLQATYASDRLSVYRQKVPTTSSFGSINLLERLAEFWKTLKFPSLLKDMIKATNQ